MKNVKLLFSLLCFFLLFALSSCIKEDDFDDTPEGNFEALWKIIDEQYCFLDYKNIDWDAVHTKYKTRISSGMNDYGLFEVLRDMLAELKDGHVNLYTPFDVARYWNWFEDYPANFSDSIQRNYLGTDYKIASGLKYKILDDNIGYIYYGDFSAGLGEGNLDQVLINLAICDGIIIDVRNNGGGTITNSSKLAARFTNEKVLTGYIQHKTEPGHNEFSSPLAIYLEPSDRVRWQKKVAVLTNRHAYSATNDFVNNMQSIESGLITIIGDKTGGGSGLPFSSELPNGWTVRFSASPHLDKNMNQIEFGIDPNIKQDMTAEDFAKNKDSIIERAREFLKN